MFTAFSKTCLVLALALALLGCDDHSHGPDHDHDAATDECSHGHEQEAEGGDGGEGDLLGTPTGTACPPSSTLTWENFGEEFMTSYCTRCHSSKLACGERNDAPLDHDFDSREGVLHVANHVDRYAAAGTDAVNELMPKNGVKPSEEERRKLGEWLACGTK